MKLYHFTSAHHLPSILAEGVLQTTDPYLFADGPLTFLTETGELRTIGGPIRGQPVVWLLDTPTADLGHGLSSEKRDIRLTVDVPDARPWLTWLTAHHHDSAWVRAVVRVGGGMKAARHWYVVARPIPRSEWVDVQIDGPS